MSMLYQQSGSFGKPIAVFNRYKVIEDSTKTVNTAAVIYSGRPVSLNASGELVAAATDALVYGLARFQKNTYVDEVVDDFGFYGSKKGTVIVEGIVEVTQNVFTDSVGTETTVKTYDDTLTYVPNEPLYVDITNTTYVITNVKDGANAATFLGYVLAIDTTNKVLQIKLQKPSA